MGSFLQCRELLATIFQPFQVLSLRGSEVAETLLDRNRSMGTPGGPGTGCRSRSCGGTAQKERLEPGAPSGVEQKQMDPAFTLCASASPCCPVSCSPPTAEETGPGPPYCWGGRSPKTEGGLQPLETPMQVICILQRQESGRTQC